MSQRHCVLSPVLQSERGALERQHHAVVDSVLKHLKLSSRPLQIIVGAFADETQLLERLYYKNKNQHRSSLLFRRVSEVRRYAGRVEDMKLLSLIDGLRLSFFPKVDRASSKALKGSWVQYPDQAYVSRVVERLIAASSFVTKMQAVLCKAYQSSLLSMQTGAFIQLVLTLTAITARMSSLVSDMDGLLQQTTSIVKRLYLIYEPIPSSAPTGSSIHSLDATDDDNLRSSALFSMTSAPEASLIEQRVVQPNQSGFHKKGAKKKTDVLPKKSKKRDEIDDIFEF